MELTAQGTLADSSVLGGSISQLAFDADLHGDTAHLKANGAFADFDPATASGRPALKGTLDGTVELDATVSGASQGLTADHLDATTRLSVQHSTIGGLEIDQADVDADYHRSVAVIRALDIKGRDLNVQAKRHAGAERYRSIGCEIRGRLAESERNRQAHRPAADRHREWRDCHRSQHELTAVGNFTGDGVSAATTERSRLGRTR